MRSRSGWYHRYAFAFAGIALSFPLALGFAPSIVTVAIGMPIILAAVCALSVYAYRQPVSPHRYGRLHVAMIISWGALHTVTMLVGTTLFPNMLWWWVAGALLCALPPLIAALYARAAFQEPRA
ncbi:hypothetical protein GCM10027570_16930 [Streptomonospora sediminis]